MTPTPTTQASRTPSLSNSGQTTRTFNFSAVDDSDDDDNESVLLSFGTLPLHVSEGTKNETTVNIEDDDYPLINVSFLHSSYTVDEGATTTIEFELTDEPQRRINIPLRRTNHGGASNSDYSVPSSVVFESDETRKSIEFLAREDTIDDDDESVTLSFSSSLPDNVDVDTTDTATVNITDDDDPPVNVRFRESSHTLEEGESVDVEVFLNKAPERSVTIPINIEDRGGASNSDYSGVPGSVFFGENDTSTKFAFLAVNDTEDDDDESVRLSFGDLPPNVNAISPNQATFNIGDNDDPEVRVSFEQGDTYTVNEGGSVSIRITLNAQPERARSTYRSRPQTRDLRSADDYSVPDAVEFTSSQTSRNNQLLG